MNPTQQTIKLSERVLKSLGITQDGARWEQLIVSLLKRLELDAKDREDAEREYANLADYIATRLDIPRHDVDVFPQGSMRTQTTVRPRGTANFDIDIVVRLSGPKYEYPDSKTMFDEFGSALQGREHLTGKPTPRRRCWRLQYPKKTYYFDVTPAVPDRLRETGAALRVRDPDTKWSPSNPEEFAQWFCGKADLHFNFIRTGTSTAVEARKSIDPLPNGPVGIDDILRRSVQLMKLHRDNFYHYLDEKQKEAAPISVIIVTLATLAYEELWNTHRTAMVSPIQVVLAVVEEMPNYIRRDGSGRYVISNPELQSENFADRWNSDHGARAREFQRWHARLQEDLEALLADEYSKSTEGKLRSVFGEAGVEAWRDSLQSAAGANPLLGSLVAAAGAQPRNPSTTTPLSRKTNTLA